MSRYKGRCDIFFGVEHRLRKEETEEELNKEAKEGWRLAANAAGIIDERAGIEDQKHSSGGVFVAVDSNLGVVVGETEGAVTSNPGNEGRITKAWVKCAWVHEFFSILGAYGGMVPKKRSHFGGGAEESQSHSTSMARGM